MAVQVSCNGLAGKKAKKGLSRVFSKEMKIFCPTMFRAADSSKMTAAMPVLPSACEGQDSPPPVAAGETDCAPFAG
jgi:hypothetical protein